MNLLTTINQIKNKISLKMIIASTLLLLGGGIAINQANAEFYPNRVPFDYNKACDPTDNDPYDRCGSLDGPVFNSFINTPSRGD